jgi:sorting nexin-4
MDVGSSSNDYGDAEWQQAGRNADPQDLAGPGTHGILDCMVDQPQKEGEGTQNAYVSYLVTTNVRIYSPRELQWRVTY